MMNKNEWKKVKLGDVCKIVSGSTPKTHVKEYWNGNINWLTPAEVKENEIIIYNTERKITEKAVKDTNLKLLPKGTVILSSRAPIGKIAIAGTEMYCNQGFKNLICSEKIYSLYLYYFLKKKKIFLNSLGRGATFKEISKTIVENIEITLPNYEEQIYISKIFNNLDNILKLKQQQLFEFEKLVKFQFLEIFGDPILNEKNWKKIFLSDCCVINPKKNEIKLDDNFSLSFIGMADVSEKGKINTSNIKLYKEVKNGFTYFKENDVLFAKITPCMENGKGGITKNLYNKIGFGSTEFHVLRPIENISNSYWLYYLTMLPFFRKNAEKNMTGSAGQKRVPVTYFQKTLIALPPIELQNKFADFVKQVDKSKVAFYNSPILEEVA